MNILYKKATHPAGCSELSSQITGSDITGGLRQTEQIVMNKTNNLAKSRSLGSGIV